MTTMAPEARLFGGLHLRAADTTESLSRMEGMAVPYNAPTNVGWYEEEFAPGAFAKSIKESARALPLLLFHNSQAFPIGAAESWDERADGLWGVWRLDESEDAQRAARMARDGMLTGLSVGFMPIRSEWVLAEGAGEMDRVTRKEARLLETSQVPAPAYKEAGVTLVRSMDRGRQRDAVGTPVLDEARAALARIRAGAR